jgi:transcriptional regulator with XRE-family HTH domain
MIPRVFPKYIAMIELSRQFPSPKALDRIAAALGIEAGESFEVQFLGFSYLSVWADHRSGGVNFLQSLYPYAFALAPENLCLQQTQ